MNYILVGSPHVQPNVSQHVPHYSHSQPSTFATMIGPLMNHQSVKIIKGGMILSIFYANINLVIYCSNNKNWVI